MSRIALLVAMVAGVGACATASGEREARLGFAAGCGLIAALKSNDALLADEPTDEINKDILFWGAQFGKFVTDEAEHHRVMDGNSRALAKRIEGKSHDDAWAELADDWSKCQAERARIEHAALVVGGAHG